MPEPVDNSIWVLTDDRAGNVAQALGVAEALGDITGRPFTPKDIRYTPLAKLPLQGPTVLGLTGESRGGLTPPWPALVIGAGTTHAEVASSDAVRAAIDKPFDKPLIQTRHGIGYRLVDPEAAS